MSKKLIAEICHVHPQQPTAVAAILLAIRARMEHKAKLQNRIGKTFPNGNRGVMFVGKAGVGKTRFMKKVFHGLGLEGVSAEGKVIGKWLPSTGGSTGKGMYEVLEVYNDAIIFADELSLDTDQHVHTMKQIANGELVRPRHGNIESVPFYGLLVGATNAIRLPGGTRDLEHLLATLDRFMVVKAKTAHRTPSETLEMVLTDDQGTEPNWKAIAKALMSKNVRNLNTNEVTKLREVWKTKSREILDPTRAQFRNAHAVVDIFLFCKRFFGVKDLTQDKEAMAFTCKMVDDCILFNPVGLLWLSPLEQVIYDVVSSKETVPTSEIINRIAGTGIYCSRMTVMRTINRMMDNHLIVRTSHGKYSTKTGSNDVSLDRESETDLSSVLEPVQPKEVTDLVNQL